MNKKALKRKILLIFAPRFIWCVLWILYFLSRNKFYIDAKILDSQKTRESAQDSRYESRESQNAIFVFWHGEFLMLPFLYRKIRKIPNVFVIASEHFDGELMAKLYSLFGFKSIRGSTSKGGRRVLIQSLKELKNGSDMAITPDGPKGPYHSIADGVVAMAQKTSVRVVVMHVRASKFWELKTWDKFQIPKPFGQINYFARKPFLVDSALSLEKAKELVFAEMTKY